MTIWLMSVACWIAKATNTHSQYVILTAVALQLRLQERASMLPYTYIARLALPYVHVYRLSRSPLRRGTLPVSLSLTYRYIARLALPYVQVHSLSRSPLRTGK